MFGIHANVARLHLTKLEDVSLLASDTKKSGKGGRPSRFYEVSDKVVQIQFPFRDYERLAELAMQSLVKFGEDGKKELQKIGENFGKEAVDHYMYYINTSGNSLSLKEKVDVIRKVAVQQGLNPEIFLTENNRYVTFRIYNCPYKGLIGKHASSLCSMHHAMIEGMFESVFPAADVEEEALMAGGEFPFCSYRAVRL
ncbi:metalloregulator ArsR/SmtB family transcription factor [Alteribacillus sp. YIM 98480]|uniref:helix-turn-helix transcriptional regulator n=1 Tax=Alteribacillus sp. YIM 98480 TaxID=2606599 RepID=UPI00131D877C|nr:methanogen output domain 1-containing protein [Alteribacillus sp. YIM 98480]